MSDGKTGSLIEKNNFLGIISALKSWLWVIQQKMIIFRGGRLLCCTWRSRMFIGYKKAFFSQHMIDSKAGGPIEKSNFWGIIFSLKLGLWVTQKMINSGASACFSVAGVQICLLDIKKISSPNIWTTAKRVILSKKAIFEASYFL